MSDILKAFIECKKQLEKIAPHKEEIWVGNMVLADAHVFRFIPELTDIPTTVGYFQHHWGVNVIETNKVPEMELWFVRDGKPYKKTSFGLNPQPQHQWGDMIPYEQLNQMKDVL